MRSRLLSSVGEMKDNYDNLCNLPIVKRVCSENYQLTELVNKLQQEINDIKQMSTTEKHIKLEIKDSVPLVKTDDIEKELADLT